jgi:hypothetical protein
MDSWNFLDIFSLLLLLLLYVLDPAKSGEVGLGWQAAHQTCSPFLSLFFEVGWTRPSHMSRVETGLTRLGWAD